MPEGGGIAHILQIERAQKKSLRKCKKKKSWEGVPRIGKERYSKKRNGCTVHGKRPEQNGRKNNLGGENRTFQNLRLGVQEKLGPRSATQKTFIESWQGKEKSEKNQGRVWGILKRNCADGGCSQLGTGVELQEAVGVEDCSNCFAE